MSPETVFRKFTFWLAALICLGIFLGYVVDFLEKGCRLR